MRKMIKALNPYDDTHFPKLCHPTFYSQDVSASTRDPGQQTC